MEAILILILSAFGLTGASVELAPQQATTAQQFQQWAASHADLCRSYGLQQVVHYGPDLWGDGAPIEGYSCE